MPQAIGATHWIIPDGYIPPTSSGELESHESVCVLNCGTEAAKLEFTIYFEDRDPIEQIEYVGLEDGRSIFERHCCLLATNRFRRVFRMRLK